MLLSSHHNHELTYLLISTKESERKREKTAKALAFYFTPHSSFHPFEEKKEKVGYLSPC